MSRELFNKLIENEKNDIYPFHMPGHKRHILAGEEEDIISQIRKIDITEIPGFDDLHHANDVLKRLEKRISKLYGTKESHILINGSSCGILAAVNSSLKSGQTLLMGRNCHKSAYNAALIGRYNTAYVLPKAEQDGLFSGAVTAADVKTCLDESNAKAVLIVSPTYEGIVSDIESIARVCHERNCILIVDEAHGAHFGINDSFTNKYGMKSGVAHADIVVQSLHKTLPSYTQTAVIHVCSDLVDRDRVRQCLSVFQSSSPSYIFMAGIEKCISLLEENKDELFEDYRALLEDFYLKAKKLQNIHVFDFSEKSSDAFGFDIGKIVILSENLSINGNELSDILLNQYKIQTELCCREYCLCMTSIADTKEGFDRLLKALFEIDSKIEKRQKALAEDYKKVILPEKAMTLYEAFECSTESVNISECEGRICGESIFAYPPGIPLIAPGEVFSRAIISKIMSICNIDDGLYGIAKGQKVNVCKIEKDE